MFRRTCGDYARVFFAFAREAAGAIGAPGIPCALCYWGTSLHDPGENRVAGSNPYGHQPNIESFNQNQPARAQGRP